jgi:L-aspartate oxidase
VVARAITRRLNERGLDHLWLDATSIPEFATRFPTVNGACLRVGLDPSTDWLPVAPAAHYLSGGVCTDLDGATSLPGLWACGEAACSGVHGANRLASNSLLDGLVFGSRTVEAIARGKSSPDETGVMRGMLSLDGDVGTSEAGRYAAPSTSPVRTRQPSETARSAREELQDVMTRGAGVLRDAASLSAVLAHLAELADPDPEFVNVQAVSIALVRAALAREESRGTHTRVDFPETSAAMAGRFVFAGGSEPAFVPLPERAVSR